VAHRHPCLAARRARCIRSGLLGFQRHGSWTTASRCSDFYGHGNASHCGCGISPTRSSILRPAAYRCRL